MILGGAAVGCARVEDAADGADAGLFVSPPSSEVGSPGGKPAPGAGTPPAGNGGAPQPPVEDPCGGIGIEGTCKGELLVWCEAGRLRSEDCAARRLACGFSNADGRSACVEVVVEPAEVPGVPPALPPEGNGRVPDERAPPPPAADACGGLDQQGRCVGAVAEWCSNGVVDRLDCAAEGARCAFVDDVIGYFCVAAAPAPDPVPPPAQPPPEESPPEDIPRPGPAPDGCGALDYLGRCVGAVAEWCGDGAVQRVDCAERSEPCGYVDDETGYYCVPAPDVPPPDEPPPDVPPPEQPPPEQPPPMDDCGGLGLQGRCDGDLLLWCDAGSVSTIDCAVLDSTCEFIDPAIGVDCVPLPIDDPCGGLDFQGACDGDSALWCVDGTFYSADCAARDQICTWTGDAAGFYCADP